MWSQRRALSATAHRAAAHHCLPAAPYDARLRANAPLALLSVVNLLARAL